ncbi:alpha/beta fold hydrolase [Bacillus salipaludis]|uniref:Alpha/beta fold hydrolase n=1 Tax=Bacillus salipaludis TaxID=2547811 RepID=A0ABW8RCP2_9BACI
MEHTKYFNLRGTKIFVKTIGSGTPIIFLHGGPGGEHRFFLPHMEPLSQDFRLIFYDQRCGMSEKPSNENSYSLEDEVETLEELRMNLGLEKLNLIGESWGSMLALLYAVKYTNNVNKILLNAAVGASVEGFNEFEKELFSRFTDKDKERVNEILPKLETGEAVKNELFDVIDPYYVYHVESLKRKTKTTSNPDVNRIMWREIEEHYDPRNELHKLENIPISIVQGEKDLITPIKLEDLLLRFLPKAEFTVLLECGHWSVVEQ